MGGKGGELGVLEPSLLPFHTLAVVSLPRALRCPLSPSTLDALFFCPLFLARLRIGDT